MKRIINIRPLSEETMRKSFGASMEDKLRELKDEIKDSRLLEDTLISAIEDNYQWETQSGDYENVDPLGPSDDEDDYDDMDDAFDDYEDEEDYDV